MRKRIALEKTIERAVVEWAKGRGVEAVKLNGLGKRSLPDRMFLARGRTLFIEFKRPGEKPTELQKILHTKWRGLGHRVYVVDDIAAGKALIGLLLGRGKLNLAMDHPLEDRVSCICNDEQCDGRCTRRKT